MSNQNTIVNPISGEIVEAPDLEALVAVREQITNAVAGLRDDQAQIDALIREELNRNLARSARVGDFEVKVTAPTVEEVDWEALRERLAEIAAAPGAPISLAAVDAVVHDEQETITRTVTSKRELNKLRKVLDPAVQGAIDSAIEIVEQPQRVSVKPVGGGSNG